MGALLASCELFGNAKAAKDAKVRKTGRPKIGEKD
jgi:hypothetical protein